MTSSFSSFGIIGAGAWGTALAIALKRAGRDVTLWARNPEFAANLGKKHENVVYLPGVTLDPTIKITHQLSDLSGCQVIILATPAQHLRAICRSIAPQCSLPRPLIITAKGIELTTHRLMSEVVAQELPKNTVYILSGPSFAAEIARNLPAALTLASKSSGAELAHAMSTPSFRLYTTDDIIGTQIGGALKNVLAIACGIVTGRNLGENARAALLTRGLAEIMRLGTALGARPETLMGLSGLGDVVLSCSSPKSRNMAVGIALGQGENLGEIMKSHKGVAEGIATATATLGLANRHGVDMPLTSAIDMILRDKASIETIIGGLLARPLRHEAA